MASLSQALLSCIIVDIWQWTPLVALIILAGFEALPKNPFEAAMVDGASGWQIFRYLSLPLLKPFLIIATLIRLMDAMKVFDSLLLLTYGGPGFATTFATLHITRTGFKNWHMGLAAAESFFFAIIVIAISIIFIRIMRTREE
jgi:multiple sugar transport system permease protein